MQSKLVSLLLLCLAFESVQAEMVHNTAELVAAVQAAKPGATVEIGPGTYELQSPLEPKAGMTLKGSGIGEIIITHAASWKPSTKTLPDPEMTTKGMDARAFLIRRQGKRCRIHHNTIEVNFSIEFPFENDEDIEIDHNVCHGTVSIPKHAGGPVPESGRTFHIHHNWLHNSYSIEFVRNGVEVDHNLFDFDVKKDGGNPISGFGKAAAQGPASLHNNLISNPGRGVIWLNEPYNNLEVRNNHIVARTTATPRQEGLFGFNSECDFSTISIRDNIIQCEGLARPLFRNDASYGAVIRNNRLTNVSDVQRYENPQTDRSAGPEEPLAFECGVHGEFIVDGWEVRSAEK